MKKILFILLGIIQISICKGQSVGGDIALSGGVFEKAVVTGIKTPNTTPSCGIFTNDPRIETRGSDSYFVVDIYAVRFIEWASSTVAIQPAVTMYTNTIGGFSINIQQIGTVWYSDRFSSSNFIPNPEFNAVSPYVTPMVPANVTDISTAGQGFQLAYEPNKGDFNMMTAPAKAIVLEQNVPFKLGTFECKIKKPELTSGFVLLAKSTAYVFTVADDDVACVVNPVVGYFDKDPNIPLQEEAPSTVPEDPVFAGGTSPVCPDNSGTYTIGAAKNAGDYDWWVALTDKGADINDPTICTVTKQSDKISASVKWEAAAAGKTYYVCVQAKNVSSETSGVVSYPVTVGAVPSVVLAAKNGTTAIADGDPICGGSSLTLAVNPTETGVTYTWSGGEIITGTKGASQTVTVANPTAPVQNKTYTVVAGNTAGCTTTAAIKFTINPTPDDLAFNPEVLATYPNGTMLSTTLMAGKGGPLTKWNWNITNAGSPVTTTDQTVNFSVQGNTHIEVTGENAYQCSAKKVHDITANGGITLALATLYDGSILCNGGVLPLKASVSGLSDGTNYQYDWYAGATATGTPVRTVTTTATEDVYAVGSAGDYTVKVTANGNLAATQTKNVTANSATASPVIVVPEIIAATPDKRVVLMATPDGIGTFKYKWTPAGKLNTLAEAGKQYALTGVISDPVDYTVYMKNQSQCVSSGTTRVKLPDAGTPAENGLELAVAPASVSLCQGNSVKLNAVAKGGSGTPAYAWTPATGLSAANVGNPTLTGSSLSAGSYTYIVKATVGAKVVTAPVQVTVSAETAPVLVKPDPIYCVENTLAMKPVSGLTYKWFITDSRGTEIPSFTANSYQFSAPDVYTVKIVGVSGSSCVSDTITFQDMDVRQLQLAQALDLTSYKKGQDITSTATATGGWDNKLYSWSTPLPKKENSTENTYTVTGASADSYQFNVSVKDEKGCTATATAVTVTAVDGGLLLAADTLNAYCNGGMAMLEAEVSGGTPDYNYVWTLEGGDGTPLSADRVLVIEHPETNPTAQYRVTVTDHSVPAPLMRTEVVSLATQKNGGLTAPTLATPGTITVLPNVKALLPAHATPLETAACRWNWELASDLNSVAEASKQFATTAAMTAPGKDYKVYMIDAKGCISQKAALKVEVLDGANGGFNLAINAASTMCKSARQTLTATTSDPEQKAEDLTYEWTSMPNLFGASGKSTEATPEIQPMATGSYTLALTVTNTKTNKKNTAIRTIEVSSDELPQLALNMNVKVCEGDTVEAVTSPYGVQITGGYTWYVNGVKQDGVVGKKLALDAVTGTAQVIRVVATGANGCVADAEERPDVYVRPVLSWNPALPDAVDVGETFTAIAAPLSTDYTYTWTSSRTGTQSKNQYTVTPVNGDKNIDLTVLATDGNQCKSKPLTGKVAVNGLELECDILADGSACVGGSVVLRATNVTGGSGPFTYKWTTKANTAQVLSTDSVMVIPTPSAPTDYVVALGNADNKKGEKNHTVTPVTGKTVPTVTPCADITIPVNTKAVLTANAAGTAPYSWNWRPVGDLQSVAEATLQSPVTRALSGKTTYQVRVKDASGCISKEKELNVLIKGDQALHVEIVPELALCIGNHVRYRAVVTDKDGHASAVTGSEWKAMGTLTAVTGDWLAADYTATKAGQDTIVVVVTNGTVTATAKKVITVKPYNVPALQADNAVSCAGDVLKISVTGGTVETINSLYTWYISKDGGAPLKKSTVDGEYTFTDAGKYEVKVVANTQNCTMDTLEKEITVALIPVIAEIRMDSVCDRAKVVAITQYADTWEWEYTGTFRGATDGVDSVVYYKTTKMHEDFSGKLVAKNVVAGCASAPVVYNGTAYSLPVITLDPLTSSTNPKSVYPATQVDIEAKLNPDLNYTLAWYADGTAIPGETAKKLKTAKLSARDAQYKYAIEATNTDNAVCKTSDTVYIAVDDNDFRIDFGRDTMDVCQDVDAKFFAKVENNKFGGVTYALSSDYPGFNATTTDGNFHYTFGTAGTYNVYVKATNGNTPPDVREDTVVVRVNPTPSLNLTPASGKTYLLCENKGQLEVNLTATGTAGWKMYYRLNTKEVESFATASHKMYLTEGGSFAVDSIVDSKGCKASYTKLGFIVKDDVPRIALASTDTYQKCQGAATDLNITISNASDADYPMSLHYWVGMSENTFVYTDADMKFASAEAGEYTLDSIVSKRGCVFRLAENNVVTVEDFAETSPAFELTDKSDRSVCGEGAVEIPFKISGGKPDYTLTYAMKGSAGNEELVLHAAGTSNLSVNGSGTVIIKALTDANGCGQVAADDSVKIMKADPVVTIDSLDFAILRDENFILGVKDPNMAELNYTWQKDNGAFVNPNVPEGSKYQDALSDKDACYVLKGASKTIAGCFATDTVNVYKIPDAPVIAIDTNKTRNDLIINWESNNANDKVNGYRLMHRFWDGYGVEGTYTEKVNSLPGTSYELAGHKLDTLEFFYVQAYRNITTPKGTESYYSSASDTVGYYKYDIRVNTENTSLNHVAIYFDPVAMGLGTTAELFKLLNSKKIAFVRRFIYEDQFWDFSRQAGVNVINPFDLEAGTVLQLQAVEPVTFLQYGKLPDKYSFMLRNSNSDVTNLNYGFMLPQRVGDTKTSKDILLKLNRVDFLRYWSFDDQFWVFSRLPNPSMCVGEFSLRQLLMVLQFQLKPGDTSSLKWE